MGTPSLYRWTKKRRVDCLRNLHQSFEPNGPKRLFDVVTGDKTWIIFNGIPNNRCNSAWVGPVGDRPAVLRPGFQTRKRLLPFFFSTQTDLWHFIFSRRRQQTPRSTTPKWSSQKLKSRYVSSAQPPKLRKRCCSTTMWPPTKPRSPRPFYKREGSKFLSIYPTVLTWYHAIFCFFLSWRKHLLGASLIAPKTKQKLRN